MSNLISSELNTCKKKNYLSSSGAKDVSARCFALNKGIYEMILCMYFNVI